MENPFTSIESRLSNIETLLLELKHKSEAEKPVKNLSVDEVAKRLNVSKQSAYSYIHRGLIPAKQVRRRYLISEADLEAAAKDAKSLKYQRTA